MSTKQSKEKQVVSESLKTRRTRAKLEQRLSQLEKKIEENSQSLVSSSLTKGSAEAAVPATETISLSRATQKILERVKATH